MAWLSVLGSTVYYTTYPSLLVGRLLFYTVHWLLSPFIYIGYALKEIILIPVRCCAEFEVGGGLLPAEWY